MFFRIIIHLCLIIYASIFLGCANRNNSADNQEIVYPERAPLDGIWKGEFDIGGKGPYDFTMLHIDGKAYAVSLNAKAICVGTAKLDGENFISKYVLFALDGGPFDWATITGKLKDENQIASHFVTLNGGDTGALNLTYNPIYDTPSSLDLTQGNWSFTDEDGLTTELLIEEKGTVSGYDSDGCEYLGYLDIINPTFNAYQIKVEISQCSSVDGEYEGVSFVENGQLNVHLTNEKYGLYYIFDHEPVAE